MQLESISIYYTSDSCVLDVNCSPKLVADGKVLDPREAPNNMGNYSKDGVGKVLVTREALINNGSLFLTDDDVKVLFPLGVPLINKDTLHFATGAERFRA